MTSTLAIVLNDYRLNRRTLALIFLAVPAIAVLGPRFGLSPVRTLSMIISLGAFLGPIIFPYWFVGMDRLKGPMSLLVSLPLTRSSIVTAKMLSTIVLSMGLFAVAVISIASTSLLGPSLMRFLIVAGPLALLLAGSVSTAIYFLAPQKAATMCVACAVAIGATQGQKLGQAFAANASPVSLISAYLVVVILAACAAWFTTSLWKRRVSVCD